MRKAWSTIAGEEVQRKAIPCRGQDKHYSNVIANGSSGEGRPPNNKSNQPFFRSKVERELQTMVSQAAQTSENKGMSN